MEDPFTVATEEKPVIEAKGRDSLFNERKPEEETIDPPTPSLPSQEDVRKSI